MERIGWPQIDVMGITCKGIRKQRYTKQGILNYTAELDFNWNMKLCPFNHPLMSQSKNLIPNLFSAVFNADSAVSR